MNWKRITGQTAEFFAYLTVYYSVAQIILFVLVSCIAFWAFILTDHPELTEKVARMMNTIGYHLAVMAFGGAAMILGKLIRKWIQRREDASNSRTEVQAEGLGESPERN